MRGVQHLVREVIGVAGELSGVQPAGAEPDRLLEVANSGDTHHFFFLLGLVFVLLRAVGVIRGRDILVTVRGDALQRGREPEQSVLGG